MGAVKQVGAPPQWRRRCSSIRRIADPEADALPAYVEETEEQDGGCKQLPVARRGTFSLEVGSDGTDNTRMSTGQTVSIRISVKERRLLDASAKRARLSHSDYIRAQLFGGTVASSPALAMLSELIQLNAQLQKRPGLDPDLQAEIGSLIREIAAQARAEAVS